MNDIEQINNGLLELVQAVKAFKQHLAIQNQYLNSSIKDVDKLILKNARDYISTHEAEIAEKELKLKKDWACLCKSRTFSYQELGDMIAAILTRVEGRQYYHATRLVKHPFQVNEKARTFYQVVSFVTDQRTDLNVLLLEQLTSTMIPFYTNQSPFIKPLDNEMGSVEEFERMLKVEMQNRGISKMYVGTVHDVPDYGFLEKPQNRASLSRFPYDSVNEVIEQIVVKRYQNAGMELEPAIMHRLIRDFFDSQKQATSAVNF